HDTGHSGITHNLVIDNLISVFISSFCGGLTKLFGGLYSTFYKRKMEIGPIAKLLISYQHFTYYLILCFGIIYILISHSVTMLLHVQITLSHFGTKESFSRKMLWTTMDVDCPWWMDWFHGGLQFQVIHHLFPRMPRHNLRKCQSLVMQFC
ncbi:5479_t:CDS:2, partial [Entrophospora sp. SA101]